MQMRNTWGQSKALGDFNQHFWQLRAMAKVSGVDLGEAMREHRLSAMGYAEIVTRCRASGCAEPCALWLAAHAHEEKPLPEFCANRTALEELRS